MNTKMTFRPNIKTKKKNRRLIFGAALAALILSVVIFPNFFFRVIDRPVFYVIKPFLDVKMFFSRQYEDFRIAFSKKKNLYDDNRVLREKIMEIEAKISILEILGKENETLKAAFSAEEMKKFILGTVILKPTYTPFDTLIIDSGENNGVKEGMRVSAFGSVLLGYISDVSENMSKVKMISSFGEETNVVLEASGTPTIAVGRGGENFEIILPRAVPVSGGEKIITMGNPPMLVGFVEKIEHQTTDPLQKILFRFPLNIQYLSQVFILKK